MKQDKSNGFTLIELVATVSILLIIMSISILNLKNILKIIDKVEIDKTTNEITSLINFARDYCAQKHVAGNIAIDTTNNKINLEIRGKRCETIKFTKGIEIYDNTGKTNTIMIDTNGMIKNCESIEIRDGKGKLHDISISVGVLNGKNKN